MKKHYNNLELKQFANGDYPADKLFEISAHLTGCPGCKKFLQQIAPTFLNLSFGETAEISAALNEKHFSDDEIMAFLKAELPVSYRLRMSEHLRKCLTCKSKLYKKDPALLRETISRALNKQEDLERTSRFSNIGFPISIGVSVALLLGMLYFVIFTGDDQKLNTLQTKVSDIEKIQAPGSDNSSVTNSVNDPNGKDPGANSQSSNQPSVLTNAKPAEKRQNGQENTDSPKVLQNTSIETNKKTNRNNSISNTNNIVIANTRSAGGASQDCPEKDQIVGVSPYFETITDKQPVLRWKPVPNAVKYTVYISDTSQILIEQFETEKETSYKLKAFLESNKPYKWQVMATLIDGKTVNSKSINFSLGKTAHKYREKTNDHKIINDKRCLP